MNILFLAQRVPYAPDRGDRIRAWNILRFLKAQGHRVRVVAAAHDQAELGRAHELDGLVDGWDCALLPRVRNLAKAALALPGRQPLTHVLLRSSTLARRLQTIVREFSPHVVYAYCSGLANLALEPPLASLPCILDLVDVDSAKWHDLAIATKGPMRFVYAREAVRLRAFEQRAIASAMATVVVTERERAILKETVVDVEAEVIRNGIDVDGFRPPGPPSIDKLVVFTGVFDYLPNEQGALWFLEEIWPLVLQRHADASFALVGARPTSRLTRASAVTPRASVTGYVADVRTWLWRGAVAVAPLRHARGVQNKVIEAVAAGLPVVVTPSVAGGLPDSVMSACVTASSAPEFSEAISRWLDKSPDQRRAHAQAASLEDLRWERCLAPLIPLIERAHAITATRQRPQR